MDWYWHNLFRLEYNSGSYGIPYYSCMRNVYILPNVESFESIKLYGFHLAMDQNYSSRMDYVEYVGYWLVDGLANEWLVI